MAYVDKAVGALKAAGVRVDVDDRFNLKPGPKFYEAERRGIPLRIECGPRDIEANSLLCARRTGGDKFALDLDDGFAARVVSELDACRRRCSRRRSSGWPTARSRATRTRR